MNPNERTMRSESIRNERFIVKYKNETLNLSEFMQKHPGGVTTLKGLNLKSIDEKFKSVDHSEAAEYLLNDYKMQKTEADSDRSQLDESLEHLVDWDSAMFSQIRMLGDRYSEWVNKPVDRQLRLFDNPFFESLTKTAWYLPLIFWLPIISYLIASESEGNIVIFSLVSGIVFWTFLEYVLHRFVFHMDLSRHPNWSTFHFALHGLHHKVPFDGNRLVFPPVPAAIIATVIYQPVKALITLYDTELIHPRLVLAGALIGYLTYDMIHYYIHHGSPRNIYFYTLKRRHHNHHFVNHDKGFGISSPLWDFVFGTTILLRKLNYILKW